PFTFLAATLGGVSTHQVLACYLALAGYTFFLANLALLASVRASRTGMAAIAVGVSLLGLLIVRSVSGFLGKALTLPEQAQSFRAPFDFIQEVLVASSTLGRLDQILSTGFTGSLVGPQLAFDLGAGLVLFLCAWGSFESHCGGMVGGGRVLDPLHAWGRKRFPPGRVWAKPLAWKDAHFLHGGPAVLWAKVIVYGLCLGTYVAVRLLTANGIDLETVSRLAYGCGWMFVVLLVLEIGFAGSRMFAAEVHEKALSSLAMLPTTLVRLHAAKVSACYHAALPAAAFSILCMGTALISEVFRLQTSRTILGTGLTSVALIFIGAETILLFHLAGWLSLRYPRAALPLAIALILLGNVITAVCSGFLFLVPLLAAPFLAVIIGDSFRRAQLRRLDELIAEE
ncbi:MAG: ABC-type transport system involved in multi-copper enzyme maturation, permease component, partial [Chthoniobacter sp.]|nr:ABC-type transport system involved in multi-copper enzyme maturation, permease component [Chthoniobacter sp.]